MMLARVPVVVVMPMMMAVVRRAEGDAGRARKERGQRRECPKQRPCTYPVHAAKGSRRAAGAVRAEGRKSGASGWTGGPSPL
jgi:hypothetical protein